MAVEYSFMITVQVDTIHKPGQVSPLSGSPEVLISFSVTLNHSIASYLTSCRGVDPTSQGVCISSRSFTRYSLVTERPATAGNRTPICCVGGVNGNHYTTRSLITPPGRRVDTPSYNVKRLQSLLQGDANFRLGHIE